MASPSGSACNLVLDLGTHRMRLLRLESAAPGNIRLKQLTLADSPREFVASAFIEYPIMDPLPVEKAIRSLVSTSKAGYESTLVLLPDHASLMNLMIAPPRYSKKELEESIREDFSPIMPLPLEHWYIVHQSLGMWEEDEITLAVATIKNNLLEAGGIIQRSGLNPQTIDVNILNVSNLIEHYLNASENQGRNIALVHLGNETTSIGVFRDGQLRTLVNRPVGSYDFTKQISKHFHVPDSEAEQFKRNEVFFLPEFSPEQENLYNYTVIKNVFAVLTREIFSAMEAFLTKFREFTIQEVILSGGGANFQNLPVMLAANLNTSVRYVADLYALQIAGKPADVSERNELAAACGAFLRE
ncbi:MAG TPA: pilus assembly protein PilM [Candidatus Ozemobacteraceae bacterium]|nr:pilus assembly protein PilM [Candidatus Ozemobacteraceae bacterium]